MELVMPKQWMPCTGSLLWWWCAESERLHQTTIELCQEGTDKHQERMCWSFTGLGRVYESQGTLDETIKLLDGSSKKSARSLEDENEAVMISNYRLARIMARRGFLKESEDLLHNTLRLQTKGMGEAHINPLCTMFELGWTLQQRKQYSDSVYWLEKCFRKSLSLSNFEFITSFCTQLGSCYEEQGLYEKALEFYNETMDFLRSAKEKGQTPRCRPVCGQDPSLDRWSIQACQERGDRRWRHKLGKLRSGMSRAQGMHGNSAIRRLHLESCHTKRHPFFSKFTLSFLEFVATMLFTLSSGRWFHMDYS